MCAKCARKVCAHSACAKCVRQTCPQNACARRAQTRASARKVCAQSVCAKCVRKVCAQTACEPGGKFREAFREVFPECARRARGKRFQEMWKQRTRISRKILRNMCKSSAIRPPRDRTKAARQIWRDNAKMHLHLAAIYANVGWKIARQFATKFAPNFRGRSRGN